MNRYHLGFSGTQYGMSQHQKEQFCAYVMKYPPAFFHHGLCVGSDEQADNLIHSLFPECTIIGHPPTNTSKVSKNCHCSILREPKPYLTRNHDIVNESSKFIATPNGSIEILRSGTWATIRYARKMWAAQKLQNFAVITP